jgi:hypothetical protein
MKSIRSVLAVVIGAIVAVAAITGMEVIGHLLFPLPPGLDLTNPEQLRGYLHAMPPGQLCFVLFGWLVGTCLGGIVASLIAPQRVRPAANGVAMVVAVATLVNFRAIPHPAWFMVISILGILLVGFATGQVISGKRKAESC